MGHFSLSFSEPDGQLGHVGQRQGGGKSGRRQRQQCGDHPGDVDAGSPHETALVSRCTGAPALCGPAAELSTCRATPKILCEEMPGRGLGLRSLGSRTQNRAVIFPLMSARRQKRTCGSRQRGTLVARCGRVNCGWPSQTEGGGRPLARWCPGAQGPKNLHSCPGLGAMAMFPLPICFGRYGTRDSPLSVRRGRRGWPKGSFIRSLTVLTRVFIVARYHHLGTCQPQIFLKDVDGISSRLPATPSRKQLLRL